MIDDITYFAETNYRGDKKRFGIKHADRRRHMYIIGKTGTGKTTLLDNMTVQDIQRGNGVAVIDPHGEYAERMLSFVPKERIQDVVYFNPADLEYPFGFNMLEQTKIELRHFVASGLMSVFKKLWIDAWSARMEYFLSNSILSHLEVEGSTLMGVHRMFGDKAYRKTIVSQLRDPVIKAFWENEFDKLPEQFMREAIAAIQNKVGQFIANPLIRNITGQPHSTFNLRDIMDKKKILIVNLAKGKIGEENSKLLGAMLVTRIYLAAMSRVDLPEDEREDFYVYVDEFQNFATEAFASILSEARKYRLNLTLANQYMAQLVDDKTKSAVLRDAIIGNVGTMISFRIGGEDAEVLEKEFMPEFLIQDFVSLGFANIYLKLMIDNVASRPFSAVTLPPIPAPHENYAKEIIEHSRLTYGKPVVEVDTAIRVWGGFVLRTSPASPGAEAAGVSQAPAREPERKRSETEKPPRKKEEKGQYPAVCAVDGKPIMLPFKPDNRRPVYCQEHLSQIQRMPAHAGGGQTNAPKPIPRENRNSMPQAASFPSQSAPAIRADPNARHISLNDLKPRNEASPNRNQTPRENNTGTSHDWSPSRRSEAPKKSVDLGELRKVLQESLQKPVAEPPEAESVPKSSDVPQAGALKPGETVNF